MNLFFPDNYMFSRARGGVGFGFWFLVGGLPGEHDYLTILPRTDKLKNRGFLRN